MKSNENNQKDEAKKTVRTFALASFLNDLGSVVIYPVWPLFVTSVLVAPMHILGLIDGLGEALVSLSQASSGYLSDRIRKRKVFVWMGYVFGSVSRLGDVFSALVSALWNEGYFPGTRTKRSIQSDFIPGFLQPYELYPCSFFLLSGMTF